LTPGGYHDRGWSVTCRAKSSSVRGGYMHDPRQDWSATCTPTDSEGLNMSTHKNESHFDNHRRETELHEGATHAHRVAEQHGKQDHLTGHERSRQAEEHSRQALDQTRYAHQHTQAAAGAHGIAAFGHADIAALAHELWRARGCPEGSPEEDWFHAAEELRSRTPTR